MSDLIDTVTRIFADQCTDHVRLAAEAGEWPAHLWQAVEDAGLPLALVDSGAQCLGVSVSDAFAIARLSGHHAVPIPLVETMLANWLMARSSLAPAAGPLVVVMDNAKYVPWGRQAGLLVCQDGRLTHLTAGQGAAGQAQIIREGANIAREPRVHLQIATPEFVSTRPASVALPLDLDTLKLQAAAAALRTAQIAGAIDAATAMTIDYVKTRVQFGKPIGKFQAVQQSVAVLAQHAAASAAAADMAADAFANGIDVPTIAAAKTLASEAAGVVTGLTHQLHGAIGFSQAYALHHRTRRLWSWRDEDGSDAYWSAWLGEHLARQGGKQLWPEITSL